MKKENRKLAQQRRAQDRAKAEKIAKWKKFLPLVMAAAVIVVFLIVALIVWKPAGSGKKTDGEYAMFDASALNGRYDISADELTYVQIKVKDYGIITAALDKTIAPVSVDNFIALAKDGFYNGLTFHRIIEGFMIQGGDPQGNGTGGSKETIKGEFAENGVNNPITHVRGAISMARSGDPDSASSQFFIVQADSTYLDGKYAAFGYVTDGMEVVDRICSDAKPTDSNGSIAKEQQPVIESIEVLA